MGKEGASREPGPNAYNRDAKSAIMKKSPAMSFGSGKRPGTTGSEFVPGPGSYPMKSITGAES